MIDKYIPLRINSPNKSEHYFKRSQRIAKEKKLISLILTSEINSKTLKFPLRIDLIRISPRPFDETDNLPMAFKGIKDTIAHLILPLTKRGQADEFLMENGIKAFDWHYSQEKGAPKEYAIRIKIQEIL